MDILQAIAKRKSIRGFLDKQVPKQIIQDILEAAVRAPSAMNTQPWKFYVLAGPVLDAVKKQNQAAFLSNFPAAPEHEVVGWPKDSVYRERQVDLAKQLFSLLDIQRQDAEKRTQWAARGFGFFNAPVAVIICAEKSLGQSCPLLDLGAVMQNICLLGMAFDLGTCILDQGVMYPHVLRTHGGIDDQERIIISIALGYPDWRAAPNRLETPREPIDRITRWRGWEE